MFWRKKLKNLSDKEIEEKTSRIQREKLDKTDIFAMIISAYGVFIPIAILVLLIISFLATWWMFI